MREYQSYAQVKTQRQGEGEGGEEDHQHNPPPSSGERATLGDHGSPQSPKVQVGESPMVQDGDLATMGDVEATQVSGWATGGEQRPG